MVLPWIFVAIVGLQSKTNHSAVSNNFINTFLAFFGYEVAIKWKAIYYVPTFIFIILYSLLPHKVRKGLLNLIRELLISFIA